MVQQLISPREAGEISGHTARYIRRQCALGNIKATKLGRVWLIDRDAFMKRVGLAQESEVNA